MRLLRDESPPPSAPIAEYALIGDCRGAGLVSRDGSLDWLCLPRFDSPSLFAALLDTEVGGRFRIRPAGPFHSERRYLPGTNILETVFHTAGGTVALRDLMPVASEAEKRTTLRPDHEVLREVEALAGQVEIEILYEPRPEYGRVRPRLRQRGALGLHSGAAGALCLLRSELPLTVSSGGDSAHGTATLMVGESKYLSFSYSEEAPAVIPPLGADAHRWVERSTSWWQEWTNQITYAGPYRDAVVRSALVLKLLSFAPSGAIVAAPTTSLPEQLGGSRNWDYRYCWLRDASMTLRALFRLDCTEEANAFLNWILHATRLTWPELQVLYNVYGEAKLPERTLNHLAGYAGSRPVRTGNDASNQFQLDVYGEVIDAIALHVDRGGDLDGETRHLLRDLGGTVCRRWREPDDGIWEVRSGRAQHTHSKVLCWVALDRLIKLHEAGQIDLPIDHYRRERESIREAVERQGFSAERNHYTRTFEGDDLDASLLLLPLYGYLDAAHPRMLSTAAQIRTQLGRGSLIRRYASQTKDGLPAGEGAFGICSFWAVECRARAGDLPGARQDFEELLGYANDVGLFAEEIDPSDGAALGNFPQAFTHVGLINAALTLAECSPTSVDVPARIGVAQAAQVERRHT